MILAVGIVGNVEGIGLEGTGVKVERSHIVVDEWLRTGEPGVYAIGDVVGPPWLAHKASHEGVICVEHIAGVNDVHPLDRAQHPGLHLLPAAGRQRRADREGGARGRLRGQGRAFPVYRQRQGDRARASPRAWSRPCSTPRPANCLGAHMVGAEVTELIQGYTIAKTLETTEAELIRTIFPHPTLSETMHESRA